MPFKKKYQYYILLEIKNGDAIEHKEVKYSENVNYKYEIHKSFYKKILNIATADIVGLIDFSEGDITPIHNSIRNQVLDIYKIGLISRLITHECNRDDLAKTDIFIPSTSLYGENISELPEEIIDYETKKSNFERSRLALYYFLVDNDKKYISDLKLVENLLESFYKKYLEKNRIVVLENNEYNDNEKVKFVPEIISYINNQIKNNIRGLNTYFLYNIANIRENDLYENYGLGVYEGGFDGGYDWENDCDIWVTPSQDDLKNAWLEETNKWNQNYINSLKKISKENSVIFYLKASYDYPINNSTFSYQPL